MSNLFARDLSSSAFFLDRYTTVLVRSALKATSSQSNTKDIDIGIDDDHKNNERAYPNKSKSLSRLLTQFPSAAQVELVSQLARNPNINRLLLRVLPPTLALHYAQLLISLVETGRQPVEQEKKNQQELQERAEHEHLKGEHLSHKRLSIALRNRHCCRTIALTIALTIASPLL
jgi:hypothetical protein